MLAPYYLIHGGDPAQTEEIISSIKQLAAKEGYNKTEVFDVNAQFNWEQLLNKCQNFDLFADKTLIDIRLHSDSISSEGNLALEQLLTEQSDKCFLIRAPKLKPQILNTNWVKKIQQSGKIHATKSLPPVFKLSNAVLDGDPKRITNVFHGLKSAEIEPILILWGLTREIRILLNCKYNKQQPNSYQRNALQRFSTAKLESLLKFSSKIDCTIKGIIPGNVWDQLLSLCLAFTNSNVIHMEELNIWD